MTNKLKGRASCFYADEQEMTVNKYEEFQTIIMNISPLCEDETRRMATYQTR